MKRLLLYLFFFANYLTLNAGIDSTNLNADRFSVGLGYNYNYHQTDFSKIGYIPNCCPKFSDGSGAGINFSLNYDYAFSHDYFLSFGVDMSTLDAKLIHEQNVDFGINGSKLPGTIEYTVDSKLSQIGFFIQAKYNLFDNLFIDLGPRFAIFNKSDFSQIEEITSPSSGIGYTDNGSKKRNNYSGKIPDVNKLQYGLIAGLSYDIFLDKDRKFIISPSFKFNYALSDVAKDIDWKTHFAFGAIGFKYHFNNSTKPIEIEPLKVAPPKPDTLKRDIPVLSTAPKPIQITPIEKRPPKIIADISYCGLDRDGAEIPNLKIFKLEEFLSSNVQPLLSYIFFDENSSAFSNRLNILNESQIIDYNLKSLKNSDALATYKEVLNIIALRLKDKPNAKITLIGCNSDAGIEKNALKLSGDRAESVKKYLTDIWKISSDRIAVTSRNLPEKHSNIASQDGIEENRRVEISADDESILEPMITNDTLRDANPPTARFKMNVSAELKAWKLTIYNRGIPIKIYSGDSIAPKIIDWHLSKELINTNEMWDNLTYKLELEDIHEQKFTSSEQKIETETETIKSKRENRKQDKIIDKYSLILFDFNSSQLSKANKKIADLIKSKISPESNISIFGYADRSGNEKLNEKLAEERAKASAQAIERIDAKIIPVGSKQLFYNNDIPEGRFYSRTVSIEVETLIQNK